MPHAHLLCIVQEPDKPRTSEQIDLLVCAEIPDPITQPRLYRIVTQNHFHICDHRCRPIGTPEGVQCKKGFPKEYADETIAECVNGNKPVYRRRNNGRRFVRRAGGGRARLILDNRYIVPYNPALLLEFNCHLNVEICTSIRCVIYVHKYIHKGADRARITIENISMEGKYVCIYHI